MTMPAFHKLFIDNGFLLYGSRLIDHNHPNEDILDEQSDYDYIIDVKDHKNIEFMVDNDFHPFNGAIAQNHYKDSQTLLFFQKSYNKKIIQVTVKRDVELCYNLYNQLSSANYKKFFSKRHMIANNNLIIDMARYKIKTNLNYIYDKKEEFINPDLTNEIINKKIFNSLYLKDSFLAN